MISPDRIRRWRRGLFEPVDIASIAIFRICLGAVLVWEVWRFFANDWIAKYYIEREFYFKYFGFEWVRPWPDEGMYWHFLAVGFFACCVMIGCFYRLSSWLLFLGFTYWFLLDQTRYLNHLYLVVLMTLVMTQIPAHRALSWDVHRSPKLRSNTVPAWCLFLLRMQVGIVYVFAAIAKINGDWLRGEPMRIWLQRRADYPLIGPLLGSEKAVWFFSYGGLLFDLLVVPALLWRRTRVWALAACLFFHLTNRMLFNIGIFPLLMTAATLLLLPPDWPRRVNLLFSPEPAVGEVDWNPGGRRRRLVEWVLGLYLAIQILFPLRHWLYPGDVHWTEEGHRFSWRMKLRQKRADVSFHATDPTGGQSWRIDHREYLSSTQSDRVGRWPDMCLQFAHFMAEELREEGYPDIEIRVRSMASLNGRSPQLLIDPEVDLAAQPRNLWPAPWILPLEQPSKRPHQP